MAKKTVYFDGFCGYTVAAVTENGKVDEFSFEKRGSGCAVGDVYKGRVESVHAGMQAAFINCGLEKNCFLSAGDFLPDGEKFEGELPAVPELKTGDEIMVQIVKLPVGNKGAKVTARPSFVGKCMIYIPEVPFVGVSRKIKDAELRKNMEYSAKRLKGEDDGLIFRTAAPYARRSQLKDEYSYLKNLYAEIRETYKTAAVGELLYADAALPVRVLRDTLSTDIEKIVAGNKDLKEKLEGIINLYPAQTRCPVELYSGKRDMLDELGISKQILSVTSPRVDLENGAHIVIEKTEALTVIDVNTGKFTGDYNLEQTVYHTNILAAREIARQVKLRNIGGIVVVDFIDMQTAEHRKALTEELERALKNDKAKCSVSPMSKFGLVEFTRKRIGANPLPHMIKPCRCCNGTGNTKTEEYILFGVRAKLLNLAADGAQIIRMDMNADILSRLTRWNELLNDLTARLNIGLYAVPHKTYNEETIKYRTDITDITEIPADAVKLI
ncbi:MAG: Rne/Rng family ribonuclease [Clostridia bacterium]|nr:Rne/Rng family ribonuclease [Clostridia bacterium]